MKKLIYIAVILFIYSNNSFANKDKNKTQNDPLDKIEKIIKTKSIFSKNQIDKIKLKYKKDINKIFETSKKNKFSGTKLEKIKLYA